MPVGQSLALFSDECFLSHTSYYGCPKQGRSGDSDHSRKADGDMDIIVDVIYINWNLCAGAGCSYRYIRHLVDSDTYTVTKYLSLEGRENEGGGKERK